MGADDIGSSITDRIQTGNHSTHIQISRVKYNVILLCHLLSFYFTKLGVPRSPSAAVNNWRRSLCWQPRLAFPRGCLCCYGVVGMKSVDRSVIHRRHSVSRPSVIHRQDLDSSIIPETKEQSFQSVRLVLKPKSCHRWALGRAQVQYSSRSPLLIPPSGGRQHPIRQDWGA